MAQLTPYDLLFIHGFGGMPQAPGHVGLNLGDGTLIHPQTGETVRLSPRSYWICSLFAIHKLVRGC